MASGVMQNQHIPSEGGCVPPLNSPTASLKQPQSTTSIKPEWYADQVVGSTEVINPQNALGVADSSLAVLTDTSILTLSFRSTFISGIGIAVKHPVESTCNWIWLYIRHYNDLTQPPIWTTTEAGFLAPGEEAVIGDGLSVNLPPHRFVVITLNTLMWVDAVHYVIPAKYYWMPVMMRNAS